jgi:isoleucyl-tRNA synthetase
MLNRLLKPNLPLLGKRLGKLLPKFREILATLDSDEIVANIRDRQETIVEIEGKSYGFEPEAFLIEAQSPDNYVALEEYGYLAALNTQLTPELQQEGLVRDAIRLLQNIRKQAGLEISDRIHLGIETSGLLLDALKMHLELVKNEVLAQEITFEQLENPDYCDRLEVNDTQLVVSLRKFG